MKLLSRFADPALKRENAQLREQNAMLRDFDQTQSKLLLVRVAELSSELIEVKAQRDALSKSVGVATAKPFY